MSFSNNPTRIERAVAAFTLAYGRPPTVLVDADGVLYDWEAGYVQTHRELFPDIPIPDPGERDRFDFFTDVPADERQRALHVLSVMPYDELAVMPGAVEAVRTLMDAGIDVNICTAPTPSNPLCEAGKKAAVLRDFGTELADSRLFIMRDKTYARGDLLIDDKPEVKGRLAPEWEHVRFTQLYNQGMPGPRIDSWVRSAHDSTRTASEARQVGGDYLEVIATLLEEMAASKVAEAVCCA